MAYRIGLVVPSSNVTVENEIPALLGRHATGDFTFHASRMRMHTVSPEELAAMNTQRERCVMEVADADPDVILYACLVALMAAGAGEHRRVEQLIAEQLATGGSAALIRSSAGALVEALHALRSKRIAVVTPYMRPLAELVVEYLRAEGFDVVGWSAMEVADNCEVAHIPGDRVLAAARSLDLSSADCLVISACVQMPSLSIIEQAEAEFALPVISAATAGAFSILRGLALPPVIPGAGQLLATQATITLSERT
ncbi:maleate cis-trans isomerase [Mycobacteroides franklinii]|uniref:Maleate isomerase n=1 Tax=Mycobacteroides franklinii TaxID=948102 RepID=A0A1S1LDS8_9MYCO|nr:maleate cis-trans isomerase [Mycobacteroides franklinii]OHU31112.1 maleate cis-trans isomerase [Mycobacteroides franklinii]